MFFWGIWITCAVGVACQYADEPRHVDRDYATEADCKARVATINLGPEHRYVATCYKFTRSGVGDQVIITRSDGLRIHEFTGAVIK